MTGLRFVQTRADLWARLEALLARARTRGLRGLDKDEVHELTRLYPMIVVDVARARTYQLDPATQRRVNQLAIGAHGLIYRPAAKHRLASLARFFARDYPLMWRRAWGYWAFATVLFAIAFLGALTLTQLDPAQARLFVSERLDLADPSPGVSAEDISERFRKMPSPPMAGMIIANNLTVAFSAFALGVTAGIGTCLVVIMNGLMLGGFVGFFVNYGLGYPLLAFLSAHGMLEIFAILVVSGAGLRMGLALAMPGGLRRSAALRIGARDALSLLAGTVPMFLLAGLIEGFVTPSYLPGGAKIAIGITALSAVVGWLLLAGRGPARVPH
jgi:uncharacterized membrane protein SpoIIM required for sporulation